MRSSAVIVALIALVACNEADLPDEAPPPANDRAKELLSASPYDEDAAFASLLKAHTKRILRAEPELAAFLGATAADVGPAHLRQLRDRSPLGREDRLALNDELLREVEAIDRSQLGAFERNIYDALLIGYRQAAERNAFDFGEAAIIGTTPPYVLSHVYGPHRDVPHLLLHDHPLTNEVEARDYLRRLEGFADVLEGTVQSLEEDAQRGVAPPAFSLRKTQEQIASLNRETGAENALVKRFVGRLGEISELSAEDRARLGEDALFIMSERLVPALDALGEELSLLAEGAAEGAGIARLPRGKPYYRACTQAMAGAGSEAEALVAEADAMIEQLRESLDEALSASGLTTGSVGERLAAYSERPGTLFPGTDEGREILRLTLAEAQTSAADAAGRLKPDVLPRLVVMADTNRAFGDLAIYQPGYARDPSARLALNFDDVELWPRHALLPRAGQLSVPGQHLRETTGANSANPALLPHLLSAPAARRGWDLYAAGLAAANAELPAQIGRLQLELTAAAGMRADLGMHDQGWSLTRTTTYLKNTTGMPERSAQAMAERIAVMPCAALAPPRGLAKIRRLRNEAQTQLGAALDQDALHQAMLAGGVLPLPVLEDRVEEWMGDQFVD